jgi:hypothetical protein
MKTAISTYVCAIYFLFSFITMAEQYKSNTKLKETNLSLKDQIFECLLEIDSLESIEHTYLIGTKYHLTKNNTADGTKIDAVKLNNYELRYVALSRDLFDFYNFNDTINILSANPNLNGKWVVKDKMNERYKNRIDFLVPIEDTLDFNEPIPLIIKN